MLLLGRGWGYDSNANVRKYKTISVRIEINGWKIKAILCSMHNLLIHEASVVEMLMADVDSIMEGMAEEV